MPDRPRPVAVALLTEAELRLLGRGFDRFFPFDHAPRSDDLLVAIGEAEARGLA